VAAGGRHDAAADVDQFEFFAVSAAAAGLAVGNAWRPRMKPGWLREGR